MTAAGLSALGSTAKTLLQIATNPDRASPRHVAWTVEQRDFLEFPRAESRSTEIADGLTQGGDSHLGNNIIRRGRLDVAARIRWHRGRENFTWASFNRNREPSIILSKLALTANAYGIGRRRGHTERSGTKDSLDQHQYHHLDKDNTSVMVCP